MSMEQGSAASSIAETETVSAEVRGQGQRGWRSALLPLVMCLPFFVRRVNLLRTPLPLHDFVTYWAAGKLFLAGQNPYSATGMLAIERMLGWPYRETLVMLNPPWALWLVAPLALLPFHTAHVLWLAVSLALEAVCALALWRYFGGEPSQRWIALVVLATYLPAASAEHMGQITPVILCGLTGFLLAVNRERYALAGVCLLLCGLKPNLVYLVLLAVLLWAVEQRHWKVLAAAALAAAATTLAAIGFNRGVMGYFHDTVNAAVQTPCGVGGALRAIFGVQHVWLQFVPCVVGVAWFAGYWLRHHRAWQWQERLPLLLLVSIGSAPYFWSHDFLVAIPAVIWLAIQVARARIWVMAGAAYLLVQVVIMSADNGNSKVWMALASLLWIALYGLVLYLCKPAGGTKHGSAPAAV